MFILISNKICPCSAVIAVNFTDFLKSYYLRSKHLKTVVSKVSVEVLVKYKNKTRPAVD